MNIFDMYVAQGGTGFWVRRATWDNTCARVVCVGRFTGPPPYFGNPTVLADVYSLTGQIKEGAVTLPAPGAYGNWNRIDPPAWATPDVLRPLDNPDVREALSQLEGKRQQAAASDGPRIGLKVPYARKDEAKILGARWDPVKRQWWVRADNPDQKQAAVRLGFLRADGAIDR